MKNFWELIWSSFWEIQGFWLAFLSLAITILFSVILPKTSIPLYWIIIVISVALLVIATIYKAARKIFEEYKQVKRRIVPKVLVAKKRQSNLGLQIWCLLEYSDLFATDSYISFYYKDDDGYEVFIGLAVILTIQSDDKIQALIEKPNPVYQDILEKLANNDTRILQRTVVKPIITRDMI
jgi:hypothetical protein